MNRYCVKAASRFWLSQVPPDDKSAIAGDKEAGQVRQIQLNDRLADLQARLHAQHRRAVLIILQAMDSAGKDGAIRQVFQGCDPQGVRVATFKKPSGRWHVFDLQRDPDELRDLARDPAQVARVTSLRSRLAELQRRLGDPLAPL